VHFFRKILLCKGAFLPFFSVVSLSPYFFNLASNLFFFFFFFFFSLSFRKQQTTATASASAGGGATNAAGGGGGGGEGGEKTTKTKTKKQCSSVYRGVRQRPWGRCVGGKKKPPKKKILSRSFFFTLSARERGQPTALTGREKIFLLSLFFHFSFISFHLKKNDRTTFQSLSLSLSLRISLSLSLTFFSRRRAR
jgi:hypothetical protein